MTMRSETAIVGMTCSGCGRFVAEGAVRLEHSLYTVFCPDCQNRRADYGMQQTVRVQMKCIPIPVDRELAP